MLLPLAVPFVSVTLSTAFIPPYLVLFCLWSASAVRVIRGFMSYVAGNEMKCCKSLNCKDSLGLDFCKCGSVAGEHCIFHCFLLNCFGLVAVN